MSLHSGQTGKRSGSRLGTHTLPQSATLVVPDAEAVGTAIQTYDPRFYVIIEAAEEAWSGSAPAPGAWPRTFEAGEPQPQVITSYGLNQVVDGIDVVGSIP